MGNILFSGAAFIITLGVLITVHEFGHFWVARRAGVKVLRFSIGFGKPLWKWVGRRDNTEYAIAAIPLGGYVKMLDEREGEVAREELPRAFNRQSILKRFAIVFAGPFFNFLFAIIAYWIMYMVGIPGVKPIIGQVEPASIAQTAGLQKGDQFISVGGRDTPTWNSVRMALLPDALNESVVSVEVKNEEGQIRTVRLNFTSPGPDLKEGEVIEQLGIEPLRPHIPAVIGELKPGGRAIESGLKPGDKILSADGRDIMGWIDWVNYVRSHPEKLIHVKIKRDDAVLNIDLTPAKVEEGNEVIGQIGAASGVKFTLPKELQAVQKYSFGKALYYSLAKTWEMTSMTFQMLGKMVIGQISMDNLSGPITIAKYAGDTASIGPATFVAFLAIVSISLGVLNLLPIPMLDGGHLLFYVIEFVKGKPLSDELQMKLQRIGMVFLLMLMSVAFYNDFARLLG